ncbi:phytanoyl-CoA dioxygenase family protein [Nostoc sp.]
MPHYYPCLSSYVVKRGNSSQGGVPIHQDYSMVDFEQHTAVHIWCPLIDVDETNGCLKAVAGSHKFFNHIVAVSGNPAPYGPLRKLLEEEYAVPVPMPAGSAFIFDERLLHCSNENHTDALRIAVGGVMIPEGCTPLLYMWDKDKPEQLTVLEVSVEYLTQFKIGVLIKEPYPQGVKFLKTISNKVVPLTTDDFTSLHPSAAKVADSRDQCSICIDTNIQIANSQTRGKSDLHGSSSLSNKRNRWFNYLIAWLQR